MIEHPVAPFQALHGNFFYLGSCVQMQLYVNALPTVLAQVDHVLNRVALLLPACIGERFCDWSLGKIEHIGETERYEVAGKTSEILNAFLEKVFHLTWDVDRVPYCFHNKFLPRLIAFVKKIDPWPAAFGEHTRGGRSGGIPVASHVIRLSPER